MYQDFEYNPYQDSNLFSKILFTWCLKKFREISRRGLQLNTLFRVTEDSDADLLSRRLDIRWREEIKQATLKRRKPSLYKIVRRLFLFDKENWLILMWILINFTIIRICQAAITAVLVQKLLYPLNDGYQFATQCVLGVLLTIFVTINALITNYSLYRQLQNGIKLRTALTSLIFRKIMKLDPHTLSLSENQRLLNFIALDMMDMDMLPKSIQYLFLLPIVPVEIYLMMFLYFGEAPIGAVVGLGPFAVSFPFQCLWCSLGYKINQKLEKHRQKRMSIISILLKYIYTIKIFGLEKMFAEKIWNVRKSENKVNSYNYFVNALVIITLESTQRLAVFATVFLFVYMGYILTIEKIVLCLVIYGDFGQTLIHNIPESIATVINSVNFLKDIERFLLLEEHKANEFILKEGNVVFENVTTSKNNSGCFLDNLNMTIPSGKLSLITGSNMSGQSHIIPILLSEIPYTGNVMLSGTLAYYHTHPIIMAGTIKDNILLGKAFSRKNFKSAIKIAGLKKDILRLPYKEETDIFEADFNFLQKTKLNLARIIYKNSDIYLFLFPIVGIHNYVQARNCLIECITTHLKNKTRIVVSNQLVFTEHADVIFYMNEGRADFFGTYEDVKRLFPAVNEIMIADIDRRSTNMFSTTLIQAKEERKIMNSTSVQVFTERKLKQSEVTKNKNTVKAYMEGWNLKRSMYCCIFITCIASFLCIAVDYYIYNCSDEWMKKFYTPESIATFYSDKIDGKSFNKSSQFLADQKEKTRSTLMIYTIIIGLILCFQVIRVLVCLVMFEKASKKIFENLMSAVMNSRLYFFITTSSEDILELFSRDIRVIDIEIPVNVMGTVQVAVLVLTIFGFIIALKAMFFLSVLIFAVLCYMLFNWFLKTNTSIRATEQNIVSLLSLYVTTTIEALTIIRINHARTHFLQQFSYYQNLHTSIRSLVNTLHVSFTLWVSIISVLFGILVMINHVIVEKYLNTRIQWTGLVIAHTMFVKDIVIMVLSRFGHFSNNLKSVENVLYYSKVKTKQEVFHAPLDNELGNWPESGTIVFRNVRIYFPDMPSLYDINFTITSGEKVSIVGSPGSGKTLIAMLMLRLYEFDGEIEIDDVNINNIGLVHLRRKITFLSEHIMFLKGSLRSLLDPYNEYTDNRLHEVLEIVQLRENMQESGYILNLNLTEENLNLDSNWKVLIHLAWALLRDNKILIMDNITANTNTKTEQLVDEILSKYFADKTVINITSRWYQIAASDKIFVIEKGKIIENNQPQVLVQDKSGYLASRYKIDNLDSKEEIKSQPLN